MIKTEAQQHADRERARELREEKEKISRSRKERMKELEKNALLLAKKSDSEIAEDARKKAIKEMVEKQVDQSLDAVKLLVRYIRASP